MKEEYRMYLLIKAEMAKVRIEMNMRSGFGMMNNSHPAGNSYLIPLVIKTLELLEGKDDIAALNTAYSDLSIIISEDSYMTLPLSYIDFLANQRDKNLTKLGI